MKSRKLLLKVIILILIIGAVYHWKTHPQLLKSFNNPQLSKPKITELINKLAESSQPVLKQSEPIVSMLASEGKIVASRASAVLGATDGISESASQPASLIDGAAQYARYWYCKQVVDQYEQQLQK